MNGSIRKILFGVFTLFTLALHPALVPNPAAQQAQTSVRPRFIIVPADQHCHPAKVQGIAFGNQPLDALLAQAVVENLSDKTLAEIKLGGKVYGAPASPKIGLMFCDAQ